VAKVLISMPDDLLRRIDQEAQSQGRSRSAFLQDAARRQLGWPTAKAIDQALADGRRSLASAGPFESAELIRRERDALDAADQRR
jgi:hypothetical protein